MNKIQKTLQNDLSFFILIFLIIIGLFCLLNPKVSSILFPFKRHALLNEFVSITIKDNRIDPQKYWKFREFYSPGYFAFSREGINRSLVLQKNNQIAIKYNENAVSLVFLSFSSPRLTSLDMLTEQTNLDNIINRQQINKENILFTNNNSLIYKENQNTIKIIFLLSGDDMKKANGFFDYQEKDLKLTSGKNWFNITTIDTN